MKNKSTYIFISAYLALLIPTPGRFVYGLTLMLELLLLTCVGLLINALINKLKLEKIRTVIFMTTMVSFTVLYRQLFIIWQTELALTLGYLFYLPAVSLFTIGLLYKENDKSMAQRAKYCFTNVSIFCLIGLLLFLFRDIAGYGTFTFFGANHMIYEKVLFGGNDTGIFTFFASIPGALVLAGVFLFVWTIIKNKFLIVGKGETYK